MDGINRHPHILRTIARRIKCSGINGHPHILRTIARIIKCRDAGSRRLPSLHPASLQDADTFLSLFTGVETPASRLVLLEH